MSGSFEHPADHATSPDAQYVVIARRYRPQTFDELVGQEHVARALQQAISSGRVGHAYLFTGARGVGKTSAARILAKALNCVHGPTATPCNKCDVCLRVSTGDDVDVLEIDGASNNTVDEIRELRQNVAVRPSRTRFKIYIIDEVHMLSKSAFNALLKTLEEPPEHVKFVFATTEPHKIPITILSRCQRFDFAGIQASSIQTRLRQIAAHEGVEIEPAALQILASRAAGSMRDSQSLLEQLLAVSHERINVDDVTSLLGIAEAERLQGLVRHLAARDGAAALAELDAMLQGGVDVGLLLDQLIGYFRDVMATSVGCRTDQLLYALPGQADEVAEVGRQLGLQTILAIGQILDHAAARMRVSIHGRTLVEMALVRICHLGDLDELANLIAEFRGQQSAAQARPGSRLMSPAKKNDDLRLPAAHSTTVALCKTEATLPKREPTPDATSRLAVEAWQVGHATQPLIAPGDRERRINLPHPISVSEAEANGTNATALPLAEDSVLVQWQRAIENGSQEAAHQPRTSRREQLTEIIERPFVRRAMDLFDAPPGQLRYSPPKGDAS
jgi:DNA polymerase-3 subunit gamma/tau